VWYVCVQTLEINIVYDVYDVMESPESSTYVPTQISGSVSSTASADDKVCLLLSLLL